MSTPQSLPPPPPPPTPHGEQLGLMYKVSSIWVYFSLHQHFLCACDVEPPHCTNQGPIFMSAEVRSCKNMSIEWKSVVQSGHNFAHAMTAELLWHTHLWLGWIIVIVIESKIILTSFQIWAYKSFVKWYSGLTELKLTCVDGWPVTSEKNKWSSLLWFIWQCEIKVCAV